MVAMWRNLSPKEKAVVAVAIKRVGPHQFVHVSTHRRTYIYIFFNLFNVIKDIVDWRKDLKSGLSFRHLDYMHNFLIYLI